ncbi:polysaccharide deacetylase family protein [Halorhodospira halochloris]|uniref:polysaccharide deacetylase family protein n=1 Tax=Halorhodospira halochloris TaxID=1052 RepID=UPI001EE8FB8B|nr:polysaccharide deacetylase family protein [Halorhodospira halochloris]MCG5530870.1 polysaccharide deacetylase family protein [Halorhodospira halochloris]
MIKAMSAHTVLCTTLFSSALVAAVVISFLPKVAEAGSQEEKGHRDSAVVFMYHRFGEDRYPSTSVRLDQFDDQLEFLEENDFNVWSIERIVKAMQDGESIPDKTVAITVDDAYASVYEEAYPRMKERDWPMTLFVATDDVDSGRQAYMDWDQMREMQDSGLVTFANHSATHDYLVRRDPDQESKEEWEKRMREDINKAQQRLQEELGEDVNEDPRLYAYPFGEYNERLAEIITDKGYIAFGQHSGAMGSVEDPRALPRFPVNEQFGGMDDFSQRARSLPLPVKEMEPFEPVLEDNNPPRMKITLKDDNDVATGRLNCFASRQGLMELEWLDEQRNTFAVQAEEEFGRGRARYNCTAPHRDGSGRFFWFSKQWLNY